METPPIIEEPVVPAEGTQAEITETAFQTLNKALGFEIEFEGEETVDNMAKYIQKAVEHTNQSYEKLLQTTHPEIYNALVYKLNGGNPAELFQQTEMKSVETDTQAEAIIRESLKDRLTPADIDLVVKSKKDNNTLLEDGKKIFEKEQSVRQEQTQTKLRQQEQAAKKQKEQEDAIITKVSQSVLQGVLPNLSIPEAVRKDFSKFALESLRYSPNGDGYELAIPIDPNNMEKTLQALYFHHVGYDIDTLVKQRIATQATKKLFGQAKSTNPSSTDKSVSIFDPKHYHNKQ